MLRKLLWYSRICFFFFFIKDFLKPFDVLSYLSKRKKISSFLKNAFLYLHNASWKHFQFFMVFFFFLFLLVSNLKLHNFLYALRTNALFYNYNFSKFFGVFFLSWKFHVIFLIFIFVKIIKSRLGYQKKEAFEIYVLNTDFIRYLLSSLYKKILNERTYA